MLFPQQVNAVSGVPPKGQCPFPPLRKPSSVPGTGALIWRALAGTESWWGQRRAWAGRSQRGRWVPAWARDGISLAPGLEPQDQRAPRAERFKAAEAARIDAENESALLM